jgi:tetratricopeptide (TPR) repeat protein
MELNDISQEEFERIEAYLNETLSEEDLVVFKNKINTEEGFASKIEDIKTVLVGLETQALKEQLDVFHKDLGNIEIESDKVDAKIHSLSWKRLLVAAILIIAAGCFWFLRGNTNDRLYAEYFKPDPGLPTTMGSNDNYEFYEAMVDYKQGDYKMAISIWENLLETKVKNDTLNYFIGSAYLANNNEIEALKYLSTVTKLSEDTFKNDAFYYVGLAHLKANNVDAAIRALNQSSLPQSKDLLKKLE